MIRLDLQGLKSNKLDVAIGVSRDIVLYESIAYFTMNLGLIEVDES